MTLSEVAPPEIWPMTVAELADHLRLPIEFGAEADAAEIPRLERALAAATAAVEARLGYGLIARQWRWRLGFWPCGALAVPLRQVRAVDAIVIEDADGAPTEWPKSEWRLEQSGPRAVILARRGMRRPAIPAEGAAEIIVTAGRAETAEALPADLRQAVAMLAAHYFDASHAAEEQASTVTPLGVAALLGPHMTVRI